MRSMLPRCLLPLCTGLSALALSSTGAFAAAAQTTPANGPYTLYSFGGSYTQMYYELCGTGPTDDCGVPDVTTDTFGYIGAVLEGETTVDTTANTATRKIFVIDQAAGAGKKSVVLDVYQLVAPLSGGSPAPVITKVKSITLPLTGGVGVKTFMAGNGGYLFISTNKSPVAVKFAKASYAVTQVGGIAPAINVSSITADKYGYVTVSFGGLTASNGFFQFAPDGSTLISNSSAVQFMLDTMQGTPNFDIPLNSTTPARNIAARFGKGGATTQANPDAYLYISYGIDSKYKNVNAEVCSSAGCYGDGVMGAFGRVGAMIEGNPVVNKAASTVTRDVYVVDQQAPAKAGGPVVLYDYQIVEGLASPDVTVSVTLKNSVPLALAGGFNAKTFMAANSTQLYIGDDFSYSIAAVNKATLAATYIGGEQPPPRDSSTTTNDDGYVVSGFGAGDGFFLFRPTGSLVEGGGGEYYLVGTTQALSTSDVQAEANP